MASLIRSYVSQKMIYAKMQGCQSLRLLSTSVFIVMLNLEEDTLEYEHT